MKTKKILFCITIFSIFLTGCDNESPRSPEIRTIDFENVVLKSESGGYSNILWGREQAIDDGNGALLFDSTLYTEKGADFGSYYYEGDWIVWGGFAFSSNNVLAEPSHPYDLTNQFSAYAGSVSKFAVASDLGGLNGSTYERPFITFEKAVTVNSADIANTNKGYHHCLQNPNNVENLWFTVTITGYYKTVKSGEVTVYLAQNGKVLDGWETIELSGLGKTDRITFTFDSNDKDGQWLNPPMYFCIDNIRFQE